MRRHASLKLVLLLAAALSGGALALQTTAAQDAPKQLPVLADGRHALKGGESHSYLINLSAGQFFYALFDQQGIDVNVTLFKPDGSQIAVSDSPNNRFGPEPALLIAETAGDYRVDVRAPNPQSSAAHYQIKIVAHRKRLLLTNSTSRRNELLTKHKNCARNPQRMPSVPLSPSTRNRSRCLSQRVMAIVRLWLSRRLESLTCS